MWNACQQIKSAMASPSCAQSELLPVIVVSSDSDNIIMVWPCCLVARLVIKCRSVAISFISGNFDNIFPLKCCHSEPLFENLPTFSSPETTFDEFRHLFVVYFAKNRSFRQQVSQQRQTLAYRVI